MKEYDSFENSCCHGTGLESHFKYGESIYFVKENNIVVNLFLPSVLRLPEVELTIFTQDQDPGIVQIRIKGRMEKNLFIRVPRWAMGEPSVHVNKEKIPAMIGNGYLQLETGKFARQGQEDILDISIRYPCELYYEQAEDQTEYRTLWYGPWLLAALTSQEEVVRIRKGNPNSLFIRESSENIRFREQESGICFIPFADVWKEEYQVYITT